MPKTIFVYNTPRPSLQAFKKPACFERIKSASLINRGAILLNVLCKNCLKPENFGEMNSQQFFNFVQNLKNNYLRGNTEPTRLMFNYMSLYLTTFINFIFQPVFGCLLSGIIRRDANLSHKNGLLNTFGF